MQITNNNILSERYVTPEMNDLFSPRGKVLRMRELWIAVMKGQRELGLDIPSEQIERFEKAKTDINLERIREIELQRRHDIKANIEAFVEAAGAGEYLHQGMTARDLTENVEQMQMRDAGRIIFGKYVAVLKNLLDKAEEYKHIVLTARTHHQPAQPILLGRRFSMWIQELLFHLDGFETFLEKYPLRGIKGPVGTQSDMLRLLRSEEKVDALEQKVMQHLGFSRVLLATGQVYPRSLDYAFLNRLAEIASPLQSFALTMRLMAGYDLVTEGFQEGQVGSTAMPHKMNTRNAERICGFANMLKMYADGASRIAGDQWEEGDVSCSLPRRILIVDPFYASDGLTETALTVLQEMGHYPVIISREVDRYIGFIASTQFLMEAVKAGLGREEAHEIIKRVTISEALRMRQGFEPAVTQRLAENERFRDVGILQQQLDAILADQQQFLGNAARQIQQVALQAAPLLARYQDQARYRPGKIL